MPPDQPGVAAPPDVAARRRAPSRGDRREQAILDGARELFEAKPLSQVTTDELAGAAGLSRSSFYFYFDSKQAVLSALLEGLSEELRTENDAWLNAIGLDEPALRQATVHLVAVWRTHGGLLRQAWRCERGDGVLATWRAGVLERGTRRIRDKIERDRAAGVAPPGPPTAQLLAVALQTCKNELLAEPRAEHDDAQMVDDLVALTLRLLYGVVPVRPAHTAGGAHPAGAAQKADARAALSTGAG
ncbi:MAG TPA: TetR/AcrR family transcriptional regulator [Mycobacteriales bacterium]|jgi:AcrR family transcriptional regulator|nr:TetR/AcrR family transcriptional regulator [Mycobacteriales bacterium]